MDLVPEMAEEGAQWQSLLSFVTLAVGFSGDEMALPISEVNVQQDFVHCVRQKLREYYQLRGESVSYFTLRIMDGVSGHALVLKLRMSNTAFVFHIYTGPIAWFV